MLDILSKNIYYIFLMILNKIVVPISNLYANPTLIIMLRFNDRLIIRMFVPDEK